MADSFPMMHRSGGTKHEREVLSRYHTTSSLKDNPGKRAMRWHYWYAAKRRVDVCFPELQIAAQLFAGAPYR